MQLVEDGEPVVVADNTFAINQDSLGREIPHPADNARKAFGPIDTTARIDTHAVTGFAHHQPIAVMLDFVDPSGPNRDAVGRRRKTGLDESRCGPYENVIAREPAHRKSLRISVNPESIWKIVELSIRYGFLELLFN